MLNKQKDICRRMGDNALSGPDIVLPLQKQREKRLVCGVPVNSRKREKSSESNFSTYQKQGHATYFPGTLPSGEYGKLQLSAFGWVMLWR